MNLTTTKNLLSVAHKANVAVWIHGQPGIGKTAAVIDYAQEKNLPLVKIFAPTADLISIMGALSVNKDTHEASFIPLNTWITDRPCVVLIDELPQAPTAIQNAFSDLLLNKMVSDTQLHPGSFVVATGNRAEDRSATNKIPAHIVNRCWHMYPETSADEWLQWAVENHLDPRVIAFGHFRKDLLHTFTPLQSQAPYATYRSWTMLSNVLQAKLDTPASANSTENDKTSHTVLSNDMILHAAQGIVGEGPGLEFDAFNRLNQSLQDPKKLLADPSIFIPPTELGSIYAITIALALNIDKKTVNNLFTLLDTLPVEFGILGVMTALAYDKEMVTSSKSYPQWGLRNSSFI